jgi:antirestriction protein
MALNIEHNNTQEYSFFNDLNTYSKYFDRKRSVGHQISLFPEMNIWMTKVYERDQLTCSFCKTGCRRRVLYKEGNKHLPVANAHHIISLKDLIIKNKITQSIQSLVCPEFWDITNGITLCVGCHRNTPSFGRG